ncbi:hypothetical protein [Sulfurimonas sp.]|uniref:hypothetical protein n=1 Tax=Sulfurimonas sp. TaxID=2022749 RepID=UPI002AB1CC42|nr:hypothetical protein [Sulfurimonas sp.]
MGKLINLHQKQDPLEVWELQDKQKRKNSSRFSVLNLVEKEKNNTKIYRPKVIYNEQNTLRRAEILAMQSEIQKSMLSLTPVIQAREDEIAMRRRKEILNIKKTLQIAMAK